jgi:hypothetical protein
VSPPLAVPPEPDVPPALPLDVPPEPPLGLLVVPPELVALLPPEPPCCDGVVVDPDPQAAKRIAIPTLVIDFRALFISLSSLK